MLELSDHHPLLKLRMPFWFRAPVFDAWLNLVLALLMHGKLIVMFCQPDPTHFSQALP